MGGLAGLFRGSDHCPAEDRVLYRTVYEHEAHQAPDPLRARRAYFLGQAMGFPAGRWNRRGQDALYTSHEPRTAWREKLEHLPALVESDLAETHQVRLALIRFPAITVSSYVTYEGHCRRIVDRPDIRRLLRRGVYSHSQRFSDGLLAQGPLARVIVPSAPAFSRRFLANLRWNSVYLVGRPGQLDEGDLPSGNVIEVIHAGSPADTPRKSYDSIFDIATE